MSSTELYPWLEKTWDQVRGTSDNLPHSLLISGSAGLGKLDFAHRLARDLLCTQPITGGHACGQCKSCHLLAIGNHPDFNLVSPEEDSSIIAVDQVRALIEYLSLRPHTASQKVVILAPAEAMNINAANSLLKVLEEPPADTVLILVTDTPQRLLATVRSRCTHIKISPPAFGEAATWLENQGIGKDIAADLLAAANGAPLQAKNLHELGFQQARALLLEDLQSLQDRTGDPVNCAARWKELGAGFCLNWLNGMLADLIQLSCMDNQQARLNNPSLAPTMRKMAARTSPGRLFGLLDKATESSNLASTPLDDTLLIEDILIGWSKTSI